MSTAPTNQVAAMFAGEPALVSPERGEQFGACLAGLATRPHIDEILAETSAETSTFWPDPESWKASYRPYDVVNGVLHIPVKGVLLHNFPWADGNYATGYEYILRAFERGCEDFAAGNIKGIALVLHTPGGMVAGCGDTADKMVVLKDACGVPVRGFAHESAYSAGYWIASVADHIAVSRTGGVGSIGVVTSHMDVSEALGKQGVKITFIHAGKFKVEGNAYEPLSADAKARIQARIDELYQVFVSAVARNRGMDEQAVRDTEALTFTATQALSNGLADSIGPLDDALSAFAEHLSSEGETEMANLVPAAVDQTAIDTAVAAALETERTAAAAASATAASAAAVAAVSADRERQKAITGCDEATGRTDLASHIALNTSMNVDDAKAMLAAAPAAVAAAPIAVETPFDAAASVDNPELGAEGGANLDAANDDASKDVLALVRGVGIAGFAPAAA